MTFSDMITDVTVYSGEQNTTRLKAAINNMYRTVLNKFKWPNLCVQCATPITLVAGTQGYDLASDFKWIKRVWVVGSDGEPIYLSKQPRVLNNVTQGTAQFYRIYVKTKGTGATRPAYGIALEDIPNSNFVSKYTYLYYEYQYQPSDLSADTDVPQVELGADQVIVYGATLLLNAKQDDTQGFAMIGQMFTDGMADMIQRAVEYWGSDVLVVPGYEITEYASNILDDYGIQKYKTA